MKKTFLLFLLITAAAGVFAQTGVIRELTGMVELKPDGAAAFTQAKAGDRVSQSTIISTGFRSTALLEVGSTVIAVRPLTRLTLTQISASQGSETFNVNLQAGRVRVNVNPPAGTRTSMAVTSPSATASVRGTSFDFDTRNLGVSQGLVSFRGAVSGYPVMVGAGSSSGIGWYGKAQAPQPGATGTGADAGFSPTPPVGTDTLSGNTGGTGVAAGETPPPAEPDPPAPPSAPDPGTSGGGGGGGGGGSTTPTPGGIGIGITY